MCQKTVGNIYINKHLSISCSWAIMILDGHLPADHLFSLINQDHGISFIKMRQDDKLV